MSAPARNLVNLNGVGKGYGEPDGPERHHARDRRGRPDRRRRPQRRRQVDAAAADRRRRGRRRGRSSRARAACELALLGQGDDLDPARTIREELVGDRADHEWAGDATFRGVLDGLLGGVDLRALPRRAGHADRPALRRRAAPDRARAAAARQPGAAAARRADQPPRRRGRRLARPPPGGAPRLAGRRHPRPLVPRRRLQRRPGRSPTATVHQYEGGYAAYVLARAERDRQAAASDARRRQLLRKELAWLRRGPPARTAKPKFRIEAANALIADEPEPRDRAELLRFASSRLGDRVLDAEDVSRRRSAATRSSTT